MPETGIYSQNNCANSANSLNTYFPGWFSRALCFLSLILLDFYTLDGFLLLDVPSSHGFQAVHLGLLLSPPAILPIFLGTPQSSIFVPIVL